jgi:hypothetical protein
MVKVEKHYGNGRRAKTQFWHSNSSMRSIRAMKRREQKTLDMNINIWYNKDVDQWRWTLNDPDDSARMESGNSLELKTAMDDVRRTIEYILEAKEELASSSPE